MSQSTKAVMTWDAKKFDVLVPKMNEQHEVLVGMMNKLYARHDAKAPKSELSRLIAELRDYTLKHFREEEALLESMQFPQLNTHKNIHQKLLEDFSQHFNAFANGPGVLSPAFFDFLRLWLSAHIMHIDRKYGEYSHGRSAA